MAPHNIKTLKNNAKVCEFRIQITIHFSVRTYPFVERTAEGGR